MKHAKLALVAVGLVALAASFAGCSSTQVYKEHTRVPAKNDPDHVFVINPDGTTTRYAWPLTNAVPGLR